MKILSKRSLPLTLAGTMVVTNLGALIPMTAYAANTTYDLTYKSVFAPGDLSGTTKKEVVANKPTTDKVVKGVTEATIIGGDNYSAEGYTFAGWTKAASDEAATEAGLGTSVSSFSRDGETTFVKNNTITLAADTALYATYTANTDNTITFSDGNGSSYTMTKTYTSGTAVTDGTNAITFPAFNAGLEATKSSDTDLAFTVPTGKYFVGWDFNGDGDVADDGDVASTIVTATDLIADDTYTSGGSITYAGDITYTAVYANSLAVTLNANGGTFASDYSNILYADSTGSVTLPTVGSATTVYNYGHALKGWAVDKDETATSNIYSGSKTVSAATTYYAIWDEATTVETITTTEVEDAATLEYGGKALTTASLFKAGDTMDISKITTTESGKKFVGFTKEKGKTTVDSGLSINDTVVLDSNMLKETTKGAADVFTFVNLYAIYEAEYDLTYYVYNNANDAYEAYTDASTSITKSSPATAVTYPSDSKYDMETDDMKFVGWYVSTTATEGKQYSTLSATDKKAIIYEGDTISTTAITADSNLVPVYDKIYTVTYSAETYDSGKMSSEKVVEGKDFTLSANTYVLSGQAFRGWTATIGGQDVTNITGTDWDYVDGATIDGESVTGNIVLTAVFADPSTFVISFQANGGSGNMASQEITEQAGDALNACEFTAPSLKKFAGWATSATGSVVYADKATTEKITANTTLYAIWEDDTEAIAAQEKEAAEKAAAEQKAAEEKAAAEKAAAQATGATGTDSASGNAYKVTDGSSKTVAITKAADSASGKVTIPSTVTISGDKFTVTEISANAFKGNNKIKQVVIPKTVTKIGKNAFKNCSKVTKITIKANKNLTIGKNAFKGLKDGSKIVVKGVSGSAKKKLVKKIKKQVTSSRTTVK